MSKKKEFGLDTVKRKRKPEPERKATVSEEKIMFSYRLHPEVKKKLKIIAAIHETSIQGLLDRGLELAIHELDEKLPDEFIKS